MAVRFIQITKLYIYFLTVYLKSVYSIVYKIYLNRKKHEYQKDSWPKPFTPYFQRLGTRDEGGMGLRVLIKATPETLMSLELFCVVTP